MIKYILASVVKIELDAIQSESTLFFSLQTSFQAPPPASPNATQESNTVTIDILNQQADQVFRIIIIRTISSILSIFTT